MCKKALDMPLLTVEQLPNDINNGVYVITLSSQYTISRVKTKSQVLDHTQEKALTRIKKIRRK